MGPGVDPLRQADLVKAADNGLSPASARELAANRLVVNSVCAGWVERTRATTQPRAAVEQGAAVAVMRATTDDLLTDESPDDGGEIRW